MSLNASPNPTEHPVSPPFTATAAGGTAPYTSYSWTFGDGTTATTTAATTSHTYNSTGAFSVTVTVADSAGKTASSSVSVTVNARLTVTAVATPNPIEVRVAVGFTAPTTGGLGTATCKWTFGDSGTASTCSASHTYSSAGTFTAIVTATDALGVTATNNTTITVSPKLTVTLTTSTSNPVVGQTLTLTATPSGGVGTATCTWNFGDNTTGSGCSTIHTYTTSGTFTATVTATDILTVNATTSVTFNVGSALAVILVISANPTELAVSTTFTARATGGSPPYASYNWTFGDGTTATTTTATTNQTYNATGTFSAMVTVIDSTSVTARSAAVSVAVNPRLSVTAVAGPNPTEVSKATSLNVTPRGGAGTITCSWTFGDTTTGNGCSTNHTYAATGSFTATDTVNVTGTTNLSVTVNARFGVTSVASPKPTEVGTAVSFTSTLSGGVGTATCSWTFGDTTTSTGCTTTHAYANSGIFAAAVTATDSLGMNATASITVAVNAKLAVTANGSPNLTEVGALVDFTASTTGGVGMAACSWTFGDGGTANACSASHTYITSGPFNPTVTVADALGVTASSSVAVTVNARLTLTATVGPNPTDDGVRVGLAPVSAGGG